MTDTDKCQRCGAEVEDYEPEFCCGGRDCACGGHAVEPCLCDNCWDKLSRRDDEEDIRDD